MSLAESLVAALTAPASSFPLPLPLSLPLLPSSTTANHPAFQPTSLSSFHLDYTLPSSSSSSSSELGCGAFCKVKRAVHTASNTEVAVKLLNLQHRNKPDSVVLQHMLTEAKLLHHIGPHPHIVQLLAHYPYESTHIQLPNGNSYQSPALILELCGNGIDLCDIIRYTGAMEERLTKRIFKQLMSGVQHIHSRGVIHRDLKTEQLLFDLNGNLKIVDFGFSRFMTGYKVNCTDSNIRYLTPPHLNQKQGRIGTWAYMPAEVYSPSTCIPLDDRAIDVWGCGIILFICLTGYPPWLVPSGSCDYFRGWVNRRAGFWSNVNHRVQRTCGRKLSNEVMKLLDGLLEVNTDKRWTVEEILRCEWLTGDIATHMELKQEMETRQKQTKEKLDSEKQKEKEIKRKEAGNWVETPSTPDPVPSPPVAPAPSAQPHSISTSAASNPPQEEKTTYLPRCSDEFIAVCMNDPSVKSLDSSQATTMAAPASPPPSTTNQIDPDISSPMQLDSNSQVPTSTSTPASAPASDPSLVTQSLIYEFLQVRGVASLVCEYTAPLPLPLASPLPGVRHSSDPLPIHAAPPSSALFSVSSCSPLHYHSMMECNANENGKEKEKDKILSEIPLQLQLDEKLQFSIPTRSRPTPQPFKSYSRSLSSLHSCKRDKRDKGGRRERREREERETVRLLA